MQEQESGIEESLRRIIESELNEALAPVLFRGGLPLDKSKVTADGVSFTKSRTIAKYWSGSVVGGQLLTYRLSPAARILTSDDFPEHIIPKEKPYSGQDKERIVNYAYVQGYDGVDLSGFFNEHEVRIFDIDLVKPVQKN
jgi:hypothetical protein